MLATSLAPWAAIIWRHAGPTTAHNVLGWFSQMGASSTWA
jgi:hypothetical protein